MRIHTGTPKVLTPENDDLVVATPWHTNPDGLSDPGGVRESHGMRFDVRADRLDGVVNARDRVTIQIDIRTEPRLGNTPHVISPQVTWTRHHLGDHVPQQVRWWAEEPIKVSDRKAARAAAHALLDALTASPEWLRVINDDEAETLGAALAAAGAHAAGGPL